MMSAGPAALVRAPRLGRGKALANALHSTSSTPVRTRVGGPLLPRHAYMQYHTRLGTVGRVVVAARASGDEEEDFLQLDNLLDSMAKGDRDVGGSTAAGTGAADATSGSGRGGMLDVDVNEVGGDEDGGEYLDEGFSTYPEPPARARSLADLLTKAGVPVENVVGDAGVVIENIITCNSDSASPNALYVCVPSEDGEEDGHDWVDEAAEMGAVAVIAEPGRVQSSLLPVIEVDDVLSALAALAAEFYDQPAARMNTVAFIGSYGKTTTSWLARGVFEENEELALMVGDTEYALAEDRLTREGGIWVAEEEDVTLHRDCSVPFHIVPYRGKYELPVTTPDGLHLQKVLAGGADRGAESALVELCPHLLRDGRADSFRPQIVVFTNADEEKACVDGEDFDEYLERIGEYFAGMDVSQIAIINKDDIYGDSLERLVEDTGAQVLTYGVNSKDADVHAEKVKSSIWETEILVRTPVGRLEIIVPLIGEFNVSNVLAAVAVGLARGIKLVNIVAGIEAVDVIPVRFNFWFSTWHGAQSRSLAHSLTRSLMHTSISRVGVNWWRRDSRSR